MNARLRDRQMASESRRSSILPLTLDAVGVSLGGQALLADVNLEFAHGAPTVVLGPNGAGKTLLLKLCHGLMAPSRGVVRWADMHAARRSDAQAMVFQRPVLLRRSVAANVRYAMRVAGVDRARRRQRLESAAP